MRRRTGRFAGCRPLCVRADFSLAGLEGVLDSFATLQTDLVQFLGIPKAKDPIEIYLFHDKATYAAYLNRYVPGASYRRALFVKGQGPGRVFAFWKADVEVDLRHECTHALLHASLPLVPLGSTRACAVLRSGSGARAAGHPDMDRVRRNARRGQVPKLETLESKVTIAAMGQAEYRDSWAWVHFILLGPTAARDELRAYLADIQHRTPPGRLSIGWLKRVRNWMPCIANTFGRRGHAPRSSGSDGRRDWGLGIGDRGLVTAMKR